MLTAEDRNPKNIIKKTKRKLNKLGSNISAIIIIFSIIATNFLIYATGGAYKIFNIKQMFDSSFLTVLATIGLFSIIITFLFSFSKYIQNLLISIIITYFSYFFIIEYSNLELPEFIKNLFSQHEILKEYSSLIIPSIFAILLYYFLNISKISSKLYFSGILLIIFTTLLCNTYIKKDKPINLTEIYNSKQQQTKENPNKFIYISLNNLPSYNLLSNINQEQANLMLGFFANNNFKFYPNAYVTTPSKAQNIAKTLNLGKEDGLLTEITKQGYFNFDKIKDETSFLKNAFLYNMFKQTDYKIKAFQTNDLNICKVNDKYEVDQCFDTPTANINIDIKPLTNKEKTILLLSDWINSLDLNINIPLLDNKKYKTAYSAHSINQLKEIFSKIKKDKEQSAYFIDINLPNKTYMFDKNCNIKPIKNWTTNKEGFFEQNQCLFATIQDLIATTDNKTVIVLASQTSNPTFENSLEKNYINNFKSSRLTTFAIKDPIQNEFSINYDICPQATFLKNYLFKKTGCDIKELNLNHNTQKDLEIDLLRPFNSQIASSKIIFNDFYNQYKEAKAVE